MIYTFYSFKGGVGRSMALANIAELFYRRGLRVLMVDFDLEAPGLERYFNVPNAQFTTNEILGKRGVIDLLVSYKELYSLPEMIEFDEVQKNKKNDRLIVEPLANFCVPIYEKRSNGGDLFLLPAGLRHGNAFKEYVDNVQSFDWQDFYANWEGERFFDWFREAAESFADVVLIDSRTGITEVGGICTHQLADVVLMFVGANQQNLDGTLKMATSLSKKDLIENGRKGRKLSLLPIPSRIDSFEAESLDEFARSFKSTLGQFSPEELNLKDNLFTELKIPYLPYYAYQERVAVRETDRDSATDLVKAFERITSLIAALSPENSYLSQRMSWLSPSLNGTKYTFDQRCMQIAGSYSLAFASKSPYTILFLGTHPKNTGRQMLEQEFQDISKGLQRSQIRDRLNLVQKMVVRPRDIQGAILDVQPQIIHFYGHGQVDNGIVLEDEAGNSKLVSGDALASLFELFADQVQCVVMDACYSELQAQAINQHIPYVIGIDKEVGNSAATTFAIGFYDALSTGRDIDFAFKLGCAALTLEGISQDMSPFLLRNSVTDSRVKIDAKQVHP
jgi:CobQ/CobB/MinD/ParA nucleotide binding domain/CHAT domain